MFVLKSDASCKICTGPYYSGRKPHSISCGHVLCASCISILCDKPRPVCPFCRQPFSKDSSRVVHVDNLPETLASYENQADDGYMGELLAKKTAQALRFDGHKSDVRRFEDRVVMVATNKSSVEDVIKLQKELEAWLREGQNDQNSSLVLSAALLRAILTNNESQSALFRNYEQKIAKLEAQVKNLDHAYTGQLEVVDEESELSRPRTSSRSTSLSAAAPLAPATPSPSRVSTSSRATSSTMDQLRQVPSPFSQHYYHSHSSHNRSASMSSPSKSPATPSPYARSQTPAATLSYSSSSRQTPTRPATSVGMHPQNVRSPTYPSRSQTPAVASPQKTSYPSYSPTSSKTYYRSHTPGPQPLSRTNSEERWIPDPRVLVETAEGSYYKPSTSGSLISARS